MRRHSSLRRSAFRVCIFSLDCCGTEWSTTGGGVPDSRTCHSHFEFRFEGRGRPRPSKSSSRLEHSKEPAAQLRTPMRSIFGVRRPACAFLRRRPRRCANNENNADSVLHTQACLQNEVQITAIPWSVGVLEDWSIGDQRVADFRAGAESANSYSQSVGSRTP